MSDALIVEEAPPRAYAQQVGQRLRAIRKQKGLSLQDVEAASSQEFKASVLGAYERGERAISVPRLQRLASFYTVPVDQLLPRDPRGIGAAEPSVAASPMAETGITIDLTRLDSSDGEGLQLLGRYLAMIQVQRQDFNGRVLSIRRDDLRAIACLLNTDIDGAQQRLVSLGLTVPR